MGAESTRWSCARCNVSVGWLDGRTTGLPPTWTQIQESIFCLGCSRALAGEMAIEAAPSGSTPEDLVRMRRTAVIEFEIGRQPEATDRAIAQACRTSGSAVGRVRAALEDAGTAHPPLA